MPLDISDEAKRVLTPEDQELAREALRSFEQAAANVDAYSEPMPPGKADFPPLGVGMDNKPEATEDLR